MDTSCIRNTYTYVPTEFPNWIFHLFVHWKPLSSVPPLYSLPGANQLRANSVLPLMCSGHQVICAPKWVANNITITECTWLLVLDTSKKFKWTLYSLNCRTLHLEDKIAGPNGVHFRGVPLYRLYIYVSTHFTLDLSSYLHNSTI